MGVLCAVSKQVLAAAPNFQIVTFWLMMVVTIMSATVIWVTVNGFCCINVLLNGLALWSLTYFMIFNFFAVVGILTRKLILRWWWLAVGLWTLLCYLFGMIYALEITLVFNWRLGFLYWTAGLWFDTFSAVSTIIFSCLLLRPMMNLFAAHHFQNLSYIFNPTFSKANHTTGKVWFVKHKL